MVLLHCLHIKTAEEHPYWGVPPHTFFLFYIELSRI